MMDILNKTKKNMEYYYNIIENMINNYDNQKLNYEIIYNLRNIFNNNINEDIKNVINDNDLKSKFNKIIDIYDYMKNRYINKINIIYNFDKNEKKK